MYFISFFLSSISGTLQCGAFSDMVMAFLWHGMAWLALKKAFLNSLALERRYRLLCSALLACFLACTGDEKGVGVCWSVVENKGK